MTPPRARVTFALALAWAILVVAVYYRHLWAVLAAGPSAWSRPELGQSLRYSGVPWLHEAAWRAGAGIGAAAAVALAVWTCGRLAARWTVPSDATRGERAVVELATGVGLFAYALFALALAGSFHAGLVSRLTVALATAGAVLLAADWWRAGRARRRHAASGPARWSAAGQALRALAASPWWWLTVAACVVAFVCALAPEHEYDALWYHLELPRRWLQAGRPVDDVNEYVSLYPLTWDLLFGAALTLDGDVGARLVHWLTLPLSAVLAAWLARRIDRRTPPALAAAVAVTAPTVLWEATTAYVDLALALHAALAAYALVRAHGGGSRRWIAVAALQLGLGCATKHLGLVILASTVAIWIAARAQGGGLEPGTLRTAARIGGIALLVPAPWYIRSVLASGNPVFPEMYGVFGAWPPERWSATVDHALALFKDHFGRPRTVPNLLALPWDMTMHAARYGGTLGPVLLAFLPATVAAALRSGVARALAAGALVYLALWASPVSSFQMRFLVPFWIVAAPVVASGIQAAIDAAGQRHGSLRVVVTALVAGLLALNLPPATALHEGDRVGWTGWLTHVVHDLPLPVVAGAVSRQSYLDREVRSAAAWRWIDARTPPGARVLTFVGGDQFLASRARLWSETPTGRSVTWDAAPGDVDAVIGGLRRLGIGYVLVQKPLLRPPEFAELLLLRPDVLASHFDLAYEDFWMLVYRVR